MKCTAGSAQLPRAEAGRQAGDDRGQAEDNGEGMLAACCTASAPHLPRLFVRRVIFTPSTRMICSADIHQGMVGGRQGQAGAGRGWQSQGQAGAGRGMGRQSQGHAEAGRVRQSQGQAESRTGRGRQRQAEAGRGRQRHARTQRHGAGQDRVEPSIRRWPALQAVHAAQHTVSGGAVLKIVHRRALQAAAFNHLLAPSQCQACPV